MRCECCNMEHNMSTIIIWRVRFESGFFVTCRSAPFIASLMYYPILATPHFSMTFPDAPQILENDVKYSNLSLIVFANDRVM